MFLTGIADEAGKSIDAQIRAHKDLGWSHVELRNINGVNLTAVPDDVFDAICGRLEDAGIKVSCFASAIANWARPVTNDFQVDIDDLTRAIPRMHRLGTPFIRIMSYLNDPKNPVSEAEWRAEAIRRVKTLAQIAENGGVTLVHENCSGWGGLSAENSCILLAEVASPALKLVYDTGNPVSYGQDAWHYYQTVRDDIVYVHIKDAVCGPEGETTYTYCGEGEGRVRETIADLLAGGYDGGFSIEPHLAAVPHTGQQADSEQLLYDSYTEYGRRLERIIEEVRPRTP